MTQTVTKTQGLCIKHAWLNFNLQKANVRLYRSRKTRADLLGEKNKETQRYHKRCAFEMTYEPGACSASMRSWVRTPRTHINTRCTNPIIAPTVRWKSEKRDFQKPRSQLTWPWSTKEQTPQKLCLRQGGRQGRATPKLFSELTHILWHVGTYIVIHESWACIHICICKHIYIYTLTKKKKMDFYDSERSEIPNDVTLFYSPGSESGKRNIIDFLCCRFLGIMTQTSP